MAWQVEQVAAVNAITNIGSGCDTLEPSQANQRRNSYSKTGRSEIQIGPLGVKADKRIGRTGRDRRKPFVKGPQARPLRRVVHFWRPTACACCTTVTEDCQPSVRPFALVAIANYLQESSNIRDPLGNECRLAAIRLWPGTIWQQPSGFFESGGAFHMAARLQFCSDGGSPQEAFAA